MTCPISAPLPDPITDEMLSARFWQHHNHMVGFLVASVVVFAIGVVLLLHFELPHAAAGCTLVGWANSYGAVWHRAKARAYTELRFGR